MVTKISLVGLVFLTGCTGFPLPDPDDIDSLPQRPNVSYSGEDIKEKGKRACINGIPANANPYIHKVKGSIEWLDGYIEQVEQQKITEESKQ